MRRQPEYDGNLAVELRQHDCRSAGPEGSRIGDTERGAGRPWRPWVATIQTRKPIAPSVADVAIRNPDRLSYPDLGISKSLQPLGVAPGDPGFTISAPEAMRLDSWKILGSPIS